MRISDWSSDVCSAYLLVVDHMPYGGVVEACIVTGQGHQQQLGSHVAVLGIAGVDAVELPAASAVWPAAAAPLGLDMRQVERRRVVELGEELGPPIAHVLEADHRRTVEQDRKRTRLNSSH